MFEDMIQNISNYCRDLDEKQCKKMAIEQFGNMLCTLSDKGMIDDTQRAQKVEGMIELAYQTLKETIDVYVLDRKKVRAYNKVYTKLVAEVKDAFDLEPIGSIQSRYMAVGMAIGTGIGSAIMVATSVAFMSIGIALGVAFGLSLGAQKEKEAKEAGKLY